MREQPDLQLWVDGFSVNAISNSESIHAAFQSEGIQFPKSTTVMIRIKKYANKMRIVQNKLYRIEE